MEENKTVKIRLIFSIYFMYSIMILCADYIFTIINKTSYIMGLLCAGILMLIGWIILLKKNKINIYKLHIEKLDIIICVLILFVALIKIVFPDNSYDVNNYHLYFQEFLNRDFLKYDFFPIRAVNAHYFILGDRMLYAFRFFSGYRVGTLLNTLVIILMYFQLKEIIEENITLHGKKININIIILAITVGLFSENVLWNIDMYTIDFLALPFLIELIRLVIYSDKYNPIYACINAGLAVAIKISNTYFIIPLAIYYLIKHRKKVKVTDMIVAFIAGISMFGLYMVISYRITGNPIFPYANGIFKSEYFSLTDNPSALSGLIGRFGPETPLQYILWPIYMILNPLRINDTGIYTGRTLLSMIVIIIALIKRKQICFNKGVKPLYLLWVYMYLLSIFVFEGYNRYVALMDILGGILVVLIIWGLLSEYNPSILKWGSGVISCILAIQCLILGNGYFIKNLEPAWRGNIFSNLNSYKKNLNMVFKDRKTTVNDDVISDIDEWFVLNCDGSFATLMNNSVPVVGLTMSATNEYTESLLQKYIWDAKDKNVYSYMTTTDRQACYDVLENNKLEITDAKTVVTNFTDIMNPLTIIKLSPTDAKVMYNEYSTYSMKKNTIQLTADMKNTKWFVGFLPEVSEWGSDGYNLKIYSVDEQENKKVLLEKYIMPYEEFENFEIPEECYLENMKLKVEVSNLEGNTDIGDAFEIISVTKAQE